MTRGRTSVQTDAQGGAAKDGDRFGRVAERVVRVFGLPWFLAAQTLIIAVWVAFNAARPTPHFDPYPFIFLNLVFSALAAYAAPLILLAETRQADRDKRRTEADALHREAMAAHLARVMAQDAGQTAQIARLLDENREQTDHIAELLRETRALIERDGGRG